MKTLLILTDKKQIPIAENAKVFFKGYPISISYSVKPVDISPESIYDTTSNSTVDGTKTLTSLSPGFILGLFSVNEIDGNDCLGIVCHKEKASESSTLLGQQSTRGTKQVIEVYSKTVERATQSLIHEIFHALADHYRVSDTIHDHLNAKKSLEEYRSIFIKRITYNDLLPQASSRLDALVEAMKGIDPIGFSKTYRSPEEQDIEYKKKPKVTNAKAWESMHQYRIAADLFFKTGEAFPHAGHERWKRLMRKAKELGFYSYGLEDNFDWPHIQLMFDYSERQIRENKAVDWNRYYGPYSTAVIPHFVRDLTIGSKGEDVRELQKFLNSHGFPVAKTGTGSKGRESDYFGKLTQQALIRYQKANSIFPAIGYFGSITRNKVNNP